MRFFTLTLLCVLAWVAAAVNASRCANAGGSCWDDTQYNCLATGGFKTGLCPGGVHNRCCVGKVTKKSTPATTTTTTTVAPSSSTTNQCTARGGYCGVSGGNLCPGGSWVSGLCPFNANVKCCMRNLSFEKLRNCYPQGTPQEVKARLGGAVNADWITNTCAIRMSETLNCAGYFIRTDMGANTIGGSPARGSRRYAYRVRELAPIIRRMFGNGVTFRAPSGRGVDYKLLKGRKGVIMFDTTGAWGDATGHFDLWDGEKMVQLSHSNSETTQRYFSLSISVTLWEFA